MSDLENLLRPRPKPSTVGTLVYLLFGPIIWAIQLTIVYGGHTLVCSQRGPAALGDAIIIGVSVALGLLLVIFLLLPGTFSHRLGLTSGMDARPAYDRIAQVLAILGLVAIVYTGATALLLEACVQAR